MTGRLLTAILLVVCVVRTARMTPYRVEASAPDSSVVNADINTDRFTAALRFPTISTQDSAQFDPAPFAGDRY